MFDMLIRRSHPIRDFVGNYFVQLYEILYFQSRTRVLFHETVFVAKYMLAFANEPEEPDLLVANLAAGHLLYSIRYH